MESQPQNPEFRNNPEKISPMHFNILAVLSSRASPQPYPLNLEIKSGVIFMLISTEHEIYPASKY